MSLGFVGLISSIEAALGYDYIPGAIHWCDNKFDGAWSKAMDRFDSALSVAAKRSDFELAKVEGQYYKNTILDLIRKYKTHKTIDEQKSFLSVLKDHVDPNATKVKGD